MSTMNTKYTNELLSPIVKDSFSWAEVLRKLKLKQTGGNQRNIQKWVKFHNINYSHFTGARWNKGKDQYNDPSLAKMAKKLKIPDEDVFKVNGHPLSSNKLTKRLLNDHKWEYICKICGINQWQGNPLTLHLDHINGDNSDNRFENLRFLCPNCHQQTDTWGNKTP